ncbi:origin recognition complex subunit 6, partial [Lecanoromycetidae sp. Uapishka_2]
MDRSVGQALNGLIPSLSGPLPKELIELAVSLLAQSRSKASSLKAEEEIARSYACANIACERLKQTLNLPKIEPRPPCPPKVYQKLYKYLDSALPARERRSSRPTGTKEVFSTPTSSPAKPRTPAKVRSAGGSVSRTKTTQKLASAAPEVPRWVMPAIRHLCKQLGAPAAPHHIFAGVSSIVSTNPPDEVKIPALIIAIYSFVTTRLSGTPFPSAKYPQLRSQGLDIVKATMGDDVVSADVGHADVDHCMREVKNQRWTEMDWFENIPAGVGVGGDEVIVDDIGDDLDDEETGEGHLLPIKRREIDRDHSAPQDYLQAGLGTMVGSFDCSHRSRLRYLQMQDRVDYLSDDRRREYREWKKKILLQIDELEKGVEMDMEAG